MHVCKYVYAYMCICVDVYICICVHMCVYLCMYRCTDAHTVTHPCIYLDSYVHIYIYILCMSAHIIYQETLIKREQVERQAVRQAARKVNAQTQLHSRQYINPEP